ncbi:hypothetical protein CVIRNUC_006056 [Coccomyxa viridis]|uniref:TLC domain-containing protein n=1 Tax=Coccomyxa viridis TaxID=1274662 RepID=A0AAV1I7J7_9CHLO|nr:hypothetical protein CVIRNUC_006056 [Coccomyxa viridis]
MVTVLAQGSEGYYKMGEKKTALYWHDTVNVYALPVLGAACTLSLLGLLDGSIVTKLFLGYIAFDFAWIAIQPSTLPSLQGLILFHHAVTFLLLTFPYRNPAFSHFTCWDGITEINTFFLIARRQTRNFHRAFHWAYWLSFIPMRLIMYPVLLVRFWRVLEGYPWWDRGLVVGCQLLLCLFNYGMFWLSIRRRMVKRDPKRPPRPSAAVVPAAKEGKDRAEISGISSAQQNGHATNGTNGYKQESLKSR